MAALTQNYDEQAKLDDLVAYKMPANTTIYKGALVFVRASDGLAIPARSGTSTDTFVGVANRSSYLDQTTGFNLIVARKTKTAVYNGTGFAQTDIGANVYALDDNTVTKTATNNVAVGVIVEVLSATQVRIRINTAVK